MRKEFLLACCLAACVAQAETPQEQIDKLFRERIQVFFKTEELRKNIEATMFDANVASEAITAAREALHLAQVQYVMLNAEIGMLEREEQPIPQEKFDALDEASEAYSAAQVHLRETVMEHPKAKALAEELARTEARGEEIRAECEALQKQQQTEQP